MAENFYTMLTIVGKNKLSSSAVSGSKVNFKTLKVGDGKGAYYEPSENQTSLMNQVWEGNISSISIDENNSNWIIVETVIPASDGGFFIREAGIFDEDGDMIAISKLAETYKPVVAEGSTKDLVIKIVLEVLNVDTVTIKIDPNVVAATKNDIQVLESKFEDVSAQLSEKANNTDNARTTTAKDVTGAINELNSGKAKQTDLAQLSNPNLIINGDFQVWQRGTSISCPAGEHYTADRWLMWNGATATIASGGWNMTWTTGGNDNLIQIVEMPTRNIGVAMTFSCVINVPVGLTVAIHLAGATSATVSDTGTTFVYTGIGTWQNITVPIPASSNSKSLFMVQFATAAAAGTSIGITNVKLEVGTSATTFVSRLYAQELAMCQRYYEVTDNYNLGIATNYNGNEIAIFAPYKVMKRIAPTLTLFSQDGTQGYVSGYGALTNKLAITTSGGDRNGVLAIRTSTAPTTGTEWVFCYRADAEIY